MRALWNQPHFAVAVVLLVLYVLCSDSHVGSCWATGETPGANDGLRKSYSEGYRDGYRDAFRDAYREGHQDGYKLGYTEGKAAH